MKVWIGKEDSSRCRMEDPERAKREMALYAFWQTDKFRRKPELSIVEDRAPDYGLHGKPCGRFFAWLGLMVYWVPVDFIFRMDRWKFKDPTLSAASFLDNKW